MDLPAATAARPVWLRVGVLLDGAATAPLRDAHLVYDDRRILHVGPADRPPPPGLLAGPRPGPDAELPHVTALPGLIEGHAHLFLEGGPVAAGVREAYLKRPAAELLDLARARRERLLRLGIVAVRDAGDRHGVGLALQAEHAAAGTPPYLDSPGAAIHHRGRYGAFMGTPVEDEGSPEACVEARRRDGAKRIKLLVTGIINFSKGAVTAPPQMTAEEVGAFVRAARARGLPTFAHASGTEGVENAVAGGVDTVEHGFFVTTEQLQRMRDAGTAWVPTFAPVQAQVDHAAEMGWSPEIVAGLRRILDGHAVKLREAHALGVRVVAGSDAGSCGVPHGLGFLTELELLERAGLPTIAVVNAATGTSAAALNLPGPVGRLAPGCLARMVFTRSTLLATVANLRRPRTVVWDGRVVAGGSDDPGEGL